MKGDKFKCNHCGYQWKTRKSIGSPSYCPNCNSKLIFNFQPKTKLRAISPKIIFTKKENFKQYQIITQCSNCGKKLSTALKEPKNKIEITCLHCNTYYTFKLNNKFPTEEELYEDISNTIQGIGMLVALIGVFSLFLDMITLGGLSILIGISLGIIDNNKNILSNFYFKYVLNNRKIYE